jgi:hypothetical protein
MLVLAAFMMVVLLAMTAFSIDVAYMQLTRTQLRTATDAAARAGTEALSRLQSVPAARQAAIDTAGLNHVANAPLILDPEDVVFGHAEDSGSGVFDFDPGQFPTNAVRVTGRRTASAPSGSVPLFLGRILGRSTFEPIFRATSVNLDRDICLVVDRSGSMNERIDTQTLPRGVRPCDPPHPTLSRWAALDVAVRQFIAALEQTDQEEQLGLVSYSSAGSYCGIRFADADIEQPLDFNYGPAQAAMDQLSANPIQGYTNITAGIRLGIDVLTDPARSRPFARRTMVVLTDGRHNTGPHPVTIAPQAAAQGIVIHTITFSAAADQVGMRQVAQLANGNHYHAPDAEALNDIFTQIALTLPVVLTE